MREIKPACKNLLDTLQGVGVDVGREDVHIAAENSFGGAVSTREEDGLVIGTILFFQGKTPQQLFPHIFKP